MSIKADVVALATELIRQDTRNPPGNEARCAQLLAKRLERTGYQVTLDVFDGAR